MKIRNIITAFAVSSLLLIICGTSCQSLSSIVQEPHISIKSVELAGISVNGINLICHLDVENPNSFDIPFPEINWDIFINTHAFLSGVIKDGGRLRSRRTTTVDVPLSISYAGLYNSFASLWETHEAAYNLALGLRFPLPILEEKIYNMNFAGNIPMFQIPKVHLGNLGTGKIDFIGIEQEWVINIENPNAFPIPIPQYKWEYEVNNVPVLSGVIGGAGMLAASSQSPLNIKVGVVYADLLRALGTLGNSSELASMMKLNAPLPIPSLENMEVDYALPGILPVFHKPELSFQGINIRSTALLSWVLVANWEIDNKNDFGLDISNFSYNLSLNNSPLVNGTLPNTPRINAKSKTVIPVEITLNSATLIQQMINIVNAGGGANFTSRGNFEVKGDYPGMDSLGLPFDLSGITRLVRQ